MGQMRKSEKGKKSKASREGRRRSRWEDAAAVGLRPLLYFSPEAVSPYLGLQVEVALFILFNYF